MQGETLGYPSRTGTGRESPLASGSVGVEVWGSGITNHELRLTIHDDFLVAALLRYGDIENGYSV